MHWSMHPFYAPIIIYYIKRGGQVNKTCTLNNTTMIEYMIMTSENVYRAIRGVTYTKHVMRDTPKNIC